MRRGQTAFTLIELAVVLVILGILLGLGLSAGQSAIKNAERLSTLERMAIIKQALDAYAARNGYLPCPADPHTLATGAGYGTESRTAGVGCLAAGGVFQNSTVWFGTLPARNLGLDDSFMRDAWNSKLTYAVSGQHVGTSGVGWNSYAANTGTLVINRGTIATSYATTTGVTGIPGASATYAVISHGKNRRGSFPANGSSIVTACAGPTGNEIDIQNCDRNNAIFFDTTYNEGTQATTQFDDYIVWGSNMMVRNPPAVVPNVCHTGTCESWCAACEATNTSIAPVAATRVCAKFITAPLPTCTARCIWPTATMPCP